MQVFITGGAGFIGSHVVDELLNMGCRVVVLDDLSGGFEENVPADVTLVMVCMKRGPIRPTRSELQAAR